MNKASASPENPLLDLVAVIARSLVDEPECVDVKQVGADADALIELRVAPQDVGKVIGKEGRTAQSIRMVLNAASTKLGRRAQLDILD